MKKFILLLYVLLPIMLHAQIINTIAGHASSGYTGDGGMATAAGLYNPSGVAYDNLGNLYISDADHNVIRKVTPAGIISTFAGTGTAGYSGDGGPAVSATLNKPIKLYIDAANNIYVAELYNNCIRKINAAGIISTVAGTGVAGFSGDGGLATAAKLNNPSGVTFDASGNMYIADYGNYRIRKVTTTGIISTYAGTGSPGFSGDGGLATAAQLYGAFGIAMDNANNLFIADASNNRVRKINPSGIISTFSGNGTAAFGGDGGPAASALLNNPAGVSFDIAGNLYIADQFNYRIRKVTTAGIISTVAGSGVSGFAGDGGPAIAARLANTNEVTVSSSGDLVICDDANNRVRKVTSPFVCDSIILSDTLTACSGTTITLAASISGPATLVDVYWTPAGGLSDDSVMAPVLTVGTTSGWEYITAIFISASAPNLVTNGNFSAGNTGFSSSYSYVSGPTSLYPSSVYAISTDPNNEHPGAYSFHDHTSGTGNMMAINGASTPIDVWCQTITVTPGTYYDFSAWFSNWSSDTVTGLPQIVFEINGAPLSTAPFTFVPTPGHWTQFDRLWYSGTATSATICIHDQVTVSSGNDFAIDDIAFSPVCIAHDSLYVRAMISDTLKVRHDTVLCAGSPVTFFAPGGYTTYTWNTGSSAATLTTTIPGNYWVLSVEGCSRRTDTFHLRYRPFPVVSLGPDTSICTSLPFLLSSTQPAGYTYSWSTGSTASSVTISTAGTYWLAVTDTGCTTRDTVIVTTTLCCDTIILADTITTCANTTVSLSASMSGTSTLLNVRWSPPAGISDTSTLAPTLTVGTTSVWKYITTRAIMPGAGNLVVNGNFSAGNTGFGSSYTYTAGPSVVLNEGFYSVYNNPNAVHGGFSSFPDHTTGTGNMLIINGAGTPVDVWCQTITVAPNTDYDFSAWFANCSSVTVGAYVPILQFKINGVLIGSPTTVTSAPGVWNNFDALWNSGTSTSATICIYNLLTATTGNDFVIDDIKFQPYCTAHDSVYVKAVPYDTTFISHDTALCAGSSITFTAPGGYASYSWSNGSTSSTLGVSSAGTYWVLASNSCSWRLDTFHLRYRPLPSVNLGNDTALCSGLSVLLSSIQPTGSVYLWSDGSTASAITVSATGSYWLAVTDSGCSKRDTINVTFSPVAVVDLGPDTANCDGLPVVLQSSVTYTAPAYLWSTGSTGSSVITTTSGTYWLHVTDVGCPGSDTINVTIVYDTVNIANRDTAICVGQVVQVIGTKSPFATCQWLPTAGIAYSTSIAPLITPDTSAMYHVTVLFDGCPPKYDSFFIDVQPQPQVYLGGNRIVCAFDTLHLYPSISPAWYSAYAYSWSPSADLDLTTSRSAVFSAGTAGNYVVTVTTPAGCIGKDSAYITVSPGNFAGSIPDRDICPGDAVQLTASGAASYHWHPALFISDSTAPAPWAAPIATQTYTLIATSTDGCKDTVHVRVTVWPAGLISIPDTIQLYPGESYHVAPVTNCTSFLWFPYTGVSNALSSDPVLTPDVDTRYIVTATTEHGCKAVDSINVFIDQNAIIGIPNAFAPGTGPNSSLFLMKRGDAVLNYFRIFNRWGNMVFETKSFDEGWDGAYKGVPQDLGVFVYDIKATTYDGKVISKHGNVTLLR